MSLLFVVAATAALQCPNGVCPVAAPPIAYQASVASPCANGACLPPTAYPASVASPCANGACSVAVGAPVFGFAAGYGAAPVYVGAPVYVAAPLSVGFGPGRVGGFHPFAGVRGFLRGAPCLGGSCGR